jgi:acyl-CoA synthetase (AMP-forming)/AMP-acid ligase II
MASCGDNFDKEQMSLSYMKRLTRQSFCWIRTTIVAICQYAICHCIKFNVVDFSDDGGYRQTDEGRILKYGVPDRYLIVGGIPKTGMGKINKIQLRKLYG